jgi:hypothetical protein
MNLYFKYFLYSNWYLFLILGLDFITSINLTFYTSTLSIDDTNLLVKFNNISNNFIYLLAPLGNISLRLAKSKYSIKELVLFNTGLVFISSVIFKYLIYYNNHEEIINSHLNNFSFIFYKLFVSSMLSISNYYLIGSNNIPILLKFNILNMIFNHIIIRYVMINYSLYSKLFLVNLGDFISIFYILYNLSKSLKYSELDYNECLQLMVKNSISILSLNINNNIMTNMNKFEIKNYHSLSSNFSSFILLFGPMTLAIKKNDFPKKILFKLCVLYYLVVMLFFNTYYYINNINLSISNIYLLLYYIVLILESLSAIDGNIKYGIFVNITIIIGKLLYLYFNNVNLMTDYYFFINIFFIVRILLKLKNYV